jgi:hypothetical protein
LTRSGPEQKRVSLDKRPTNPPQHVPRCGRIEIADVRTEEEHEPRPIAAMCGEPRQPLFVGALKRRDGSGGQRGKTGTSAHERSSGDVDQMHAPKPLATFLQQDRQLVAVAAAELRDVERTWQRLQHLARMTREQRGLRSSHPVPRQPADRIEQRRPQWIVKVARGKLTRRPLKILCDIENEIGPSRKPNTIQRQQHHASPAQRNVA